jgi:hypothetical protein
MELGVEHIPACGEMAFQDSAFSHDCRFVYRNGQNIRCGD